ncbi:MAG: hypothetical protein COB15_00900 [Flavobacteriales bacterium]|nr:MAG: hypothetical protein COB15_00900 [Flavobacteriales bacterium]
MKTKLIILLIGIAFAVNLKAQSIAKSWYSEKDNICLVLDSVDNSIVVNGWFEKGAYKVVRIKFKVKDDKLKLICKSNQRIFPLGWEKERYWFEIRNLTDEKLTLKLLPSNDGFIEELFGTYDEVILDVQSSDCYELLKKG